MTLGGFMKLICLFHPRRRAGPFLLENRLKQQGGVYSNGANWAPYVQVDGKLVTGQNPASSAPAAKALLKLLCSD